MVLHVTAQWLATMHHGIYPKNLAWASPKYGETMFSTKKSFSTFFCYSFNIEMPPGSDKTAAIIASMLISLASAIVYNS